MNACTASIPIIAIDDCRVREVESIKSTFACKRLSFARNLAKGIFCLKTDFTVLYIYYSYCHINDEFIKHTNNKQTVNSLLLSFFRHPSPFKASQ